ncbi:MAG: hypothetical protein IJF33_04925 [Clostridia bacterium]|nr:hypothetical protein [Clostridia bacterium]
MKAFAVSVVLLVVMLLGIVGNYIYINEVSNAMNARLNELPSIDEAGCVKQAQELLSYWESHADTVGLSVSFPIVDRVSEQAKTLLTCAECGDVYGFQVALSLLRDAVGDMCRLEAFSISNLL